MKGVSVVLAIVLVLLLAAGAYVYFGGSLGSEIYSASIPASQEEAAFSAVRSVLLAGSAPYVYDTSLSMDSPEGYFLLDITVNLKNRGLLRAEWLTAELTPADADAAVYSMTLPPTDIVSHGSGTLNLKILTHAPDDARAVTLNYYIFGMKRSLKIEC